MTEPTDHLGTPIVPFSQAKIGESAYTYKRADGEEIGDYGWVTDLEWFDDRDGEERLIRQRWLLVAQDEVVLEDPFPPDDDDDDESAEDDKGETNDESEQGAHDAGLRSQRLDGGGSELPQGG